MKCSPNDSLLLLVKNCVNIREVNGNHEHEGGMSTM